VSSYSGTSSVFGEPARIVEPALLDQCSVRDLQEGLHHREPIVYTHNGNRTLQPEELLERILRVAPLAGIQRIADISYLADSSFFVFQSCRPNLHWHSSSGQNTGAQGKGRTPTQAKISCMMEALEGFCEEPRSPRLVRGSYDHLRHQHLLLDPQHLELVAGVEPPAHAEPLMWTPAYSVELDAELLVPAEAVYFPFLPEDYQVQSWFPCVTVGVAAGATYLEAATHALYELIETYYQRCLQEKMVEITEIDQDDLRSWDDLGPVLPQVNEEYALRLYAARLPGVRNIPMVFAYLIGADRKLYAGYGACADVPTAISRAVSEAVQAFVTVLSGTREDIPKKAMAPSSERYDPNERSAQRRYPVRTLAEYALEVDEQHFSDLRSEFDWIVDWLHEIGFHKVCIANLTRTGIDIPVVKALVPRMPPRSDHRGRERATLAAVQAARFGWAYSR
jgi:YcaO-like protein with predicted kinase domain